MLTSEIASAAGGLAAHQLRPLIKRTFSASYPGGLFSVACSAVGVLTLVEPIVAMFRILGGGKEDENKVRASVLLAAVAVGLGVMFGYWLDANS